MAEARLRLELEVPRNIETRAEALTAPVKEVPVGIAAPAPDIGPSAPAIDHVARATAALEVRCEQAELLGFLLQTTSLELTRSKSWLRHRGRLPPFAERSSKVDGDMILRLPRVVRGVKPV